MAVSRQEKNNYGLEPLGDFTLVYPDHRQHRTADTHASIPVSNFA
jgi:hypothetical protein